LTALAKALDAFFAKYEDVERVVINGGRMEIMYSDHPVTHRATAPIIDEIGPLVMNCPFLREQTMKNCVVVLVRAEKK